MILLIFRGFKKQTQHPPPKKKTTFYKLILCFVSLQGGIFLDMAIHDIDYVCWLVGERPSSVCAFGSISSDNSALYRSADDFDCVTAILNFPSGVMANMEDTRAARIGYEQKVEVIVKEFSIK